MKYFSHVSASLRDISTEREIEICCVTLCEREPRRSGETDDASMNHHHSKGEELQITRDIEEAPMNNQGMDREIDLV